VGGKIAGAGYLKDYMLQKLAEEEITEKGAIQKGKDFGKRHCKKCTHFWFLEWVLGV